MIGGWFGKGIGSSWSGKKVKLGDKRHGKLRKRDREMELRRSQEKLLEQLMEQLWRNQKERQKINQEIKEFGVGWGFGGEVLMKERRESEKSRSF